MFCHFGINTFHDKEWSDGTLSPKTFNPTAFDADQWAQAAKRVGMKYLVLTAKHHDGFCLWPTKTTDYSVKASPFRGGKGDVVREVADACRKAGLKFGIYLSPWDRHEPTYKDNKAYDQFYMKQLTELLTQYGEVTEVWMDGAGGEGHVYDWPAYYKLVKKHQGGALTAIAGVSDIRWVGNESGVAPEKLRYVQEVEGKPYWWPAECDVPLRASGWFWHPNSEGSIRSLKDLDEIYHQSVGFGANLLLNVAPDRRGLLPDADVKRLEEMWAGVRAQYGGQNLARGAERIEYNSRMKGELELRLPKKVTIDRALIREDLGRGQNIDHYWLERWDRVGWLPFAEGSTVGSKRLDRFPPLTTDQIRLRYTTTGKEARITEFNVFKSQ